MRASGGERGSAVGRRPEHWPPSQVADALADIQYVLAGAVHEFGLGSKFAQLFNEVQRSNMSKVRLPSLRDALLTRLFLFGALLAASTGPASRSPSTQACSTIEEIVRACPRLTFPS